MEATIENINAGLVCPYCGNESQLVDSAVIYGKSYGMIYLCKPCDAYVGTHKSDNKTALGRLANKELREAKKSAHFWFDQIWKDGIITRSDAYTWLSIEMEIHVNFCHIGMFDVAQCNKVVELSMNKLKGK